MTTSNFKLVKEIQKASDFGLEWFTNGYSNQAVYALYFDEKLIKTYTSSDPEKKIYALIEIGNKSIKGVEIVPNVEIIYGIKFSINPNKKTFGTRKIVVGY